MNHKADKITILEKIGYASGDFASNIIFGLVSSYSLIFFTDVAMLPIGIITTLLLVSRIWDAVNDPVMGILADRSKLKWGKYRSFFLILPIPLAAALVFTFVSPGTGTMGKLIYTFLAYNILMMLYTAINVPYGALITTMTDNPKERVSFSSIRTFGACLGNLVVSGSALALVNFFGKGDQSKGYLCTAVFFALLSSALFYFLFFTVKERITDIPVTKNKNIRSETFQILKSPTWIVFFLMVFMAFGNMFARISSTTYYFIYVVQRPDLIGLFFMFVTLVQVPGAIVANLASKVYTRKKILLMAAGLSVVVHTICFFLNVGNIVSIFVLHAIGGISITVLIPLLAATIGDISDYFSKEKGINAAGVISASMTLSNKFSLSITGACIGGLMAAAGYIPNGAQNSGTIQIIKAGMSLIPAVFSVLFIIMVLIFPLKNGMQEAIKKS